jgi:hypothetical protein
MMATIQELVEGGARVPTFTLGTCALAGKGRVKQVTAASQRRWAINPFPWDVFFNMWFLPFIRTVLNFVALKTVAFGCKCRPTSTAR